MGLLNIKNQKDKKVAPTVDSRGHVIQMITGQVIAVGSEVTGVVPEEKSEEQMSKRKRRRISTSTKPKVFSYRYKFINPITNEEVKAYDDLALVEVGEQIYDVGESVPLIFSDEPNKLSGNNFSVTRKIIFPEVISKKKKIMKTIKFIYTLIVFIFIFICMCYGVGKQPLEDNANTTITTQEPSKE